MSIGEPSVDYIASFILTGQKDITHSNRTIETAAVGYEVTAIRGGSISELFRTLLMLFGLYQSIWDKRRKAAR